MLETISTNLADTLTQIIKSFRLTYFFPSFCFVLFHHLFLLPYLRACGVLMGLTGENATLIILLATALIGYVLRYLNFSFIRLAEGYPFRDTVWGKLMVRWHRRHQMWLKQKSESFPPGSSDSLFLKDELADYYPEGASKCAPTALGNVMAAFEAYPNKQYGIDAVYMWPRLLPILAEEKYAPFVEREKDSFDFFLNFAVLSAIVMVECVFFQLLIAPTLLTLLALLSGCVAFVCYRAAVVNAINWGESIKTAFDLYRYPLATALALKPFESKREEREHWEGISRALKNEDEYLKFDYKLPKPASSQKP